MIKNGMLICSFLLKARKKKKEILCNLNAPYCCDEKQYDDVFSMLQEFFDAHNELADDEKHMKMFVVDRESIRFRNETAYRVVSFAVESGAYGMEGNITDRKTGYVKYRMERNDANIKRFRCIVYVPKAVEDKVITKGIMVFQSLGAYGIKTITTNYMRDFFAQLNLTFETRSVSVRIFLERLFREGKVHRLTLIKNRVSPDASDNMLITSGREEVSYIKPRLKPEWINRFLSFVDRGTDGDIFEVKDETFEDIKITFKMGQSYRTVGIADIDRFSVEEEIPESIILKNGKDDAALIHHMIETAIGYAEKMVFV